MLSRKEIGLGVNPDKTTYIFMSGDYSAGRIRNLKINNISFEREGEIKYLETNLTNQNAFQELIMSKLKSGNASYKSVQNILSSSLLPKNLKIKIYRTTILSVIL